MSLSAVTCTEFVPDAHENHRESHQLKTRKDIPMKLLLSALASLFLVAGTAQAADPVDLRGKQGIVDPNDLKKHDPKPQKPVNNPPPKL